MHEIHVDVAIVGGGLAGLVAANRLAQLGRAALVIEKGEDERYPCNSRVSGGALHLCMQDITAPPQEIERRIGVTTDGAARPDLAAAAARTGARAVAWLRSEGARFIRVPSTYQNHVLAPPRPARGGLHWQGRGPDVLLRSLEKNLVDRGGRLMRATEARHLVVENGRCKGLLATGRGGDFTVTARAVILADGGYQADADLLRRYITPRPDRVKLRNARTGAGAGLRMAEAAGAALAGMENGFYGHLLCRDAMDNDALWPFPVIDHIAAAGIVVGVDGRRFADEGAGGIFLSNAVARLSDPLSAVAIFDTPIWETAGRHRAIPPNPSLVIGGGEVVEAGSLAALAEALELPAAALAATVDAYNAALSVGDGARLEPPRSNLAAARRIETAPFLAIRLCAGVTYTFGGIAHDENGRVLDGSGRAIEGLFAAGATTGGLEGGPRNGYVGGLSKAAIFGLRAAEFIGGEPQA